MRNEVRIDNFLNKVNIRDLLLNIWKICDDNNIDQIEKSITDNINNIKNNWYISQHLRFSQILVNFNYIPNIPGTWYYYENDEILKKQGWKPRDYIFWASIYDKDGNKLNEYKYSLIKDLNISHMQKLIDNDWISNDYLRKIVEQEINRRTRKEKLKTINKIQPSNNH